MDTITVTPALGQGNLISLRNKVLILRFSSAIVPFFPPSTNQYLLLFFCRDQSIGRRHKISKVLLNVKESLGEADGKRQIH